MKLNLSLKFYMILLSLVRELHASNTVTVTQVGEVCSKVGTSTVSSN